MLKASQLTTSNYSAYSAIVNIEKAKGGLELRANKCNAKKYVFKPNMYLLTQKCV